MQYLHLISRAFPGRAGVIVASKPIHAKRSSFLNMKKSLMICHDASRRAGWMYNFLARLLLSLGVKSTNLAQCQRKSRDFRVVQGQGQSKIPAFSV